MAVFKSAAKAATPTFAFDYIEEGCNQNNALNTNRQALDGVFLRPSYMSGYADPDLTVELFGRSMLAQLALLQ